MALPANRVASWVTEPDVHWFGRCDGCGKWRIRIQLYDCYPERFAEEGAFHWQCAQCLIESLTERFG